MSDRRTVDVVDYWIARAADHFWCDNCGTMHMDIKTCSICGCELMPVHEAFRLGKFDITRTAPNGVRHVYGWLKVDETFRPWHDSDAVEVAADCMEKQKCLNFPTKNDAE